MLAAEAAAAAAGAVCKGTAHVCDIVDDKQGKKRRRNRKDQLFKGVILIQDRSAEGKGREDESQTVGMMCVFAFVFTSVGHRRSRGGMSLSRRRGWRCHLLASAPVSVCLRLKRPLHHLK